IAVIDEDILDGRIPLSNDSSAQTVAIEPEARDIDIGALADIEDDAIRNRENQVRAARPDVNTIRIEPDPVYGVVPVREDHHSGVMAGIDRVLNRLCIVGNSITNRSKRPYIGSPQRQKRDKNNSPQT